MTFDSLYLDHAATTPLLPAARDAVARQPAQHREGVLAGHRQEVHAHPQRRKQLPHMRADRQEALNIMLVIAQEAQAMNGVSQETRLAALRDRLEAMILDFAPDTLFFSRAATRLPNTSAFQGGRPLALAVT